jgi:dUTP pyrophosphatase
LNNITFESRLGFIRLEHCPSEQLRRPGAPTDAGYDIAIADDIEVPCGLKEPFKARTGIILVPPEDTWIGIYARSSLSKKGLMLANNVGVIDAGYTGELQLLLHNISDEVVKLKAGSFLAQAVIQPLITLELIEFAKDPRENQRGGIGSTGGYV